MDTTEEMMALVSTLMKKKSGGIKIGNLPRKQQYVCDHPTRREISKYHFIVHQGERINPMSEILIKVGKK